MNWAEKIVGLRPVIVTGAYLLTTIVGAELIEIFPIGSTLSGIGFALGAAVSLGLILAWTSALYAVARSRLSGTSLARQAGFAIFQNLAFWWIVWLAAGFAATQRNGLFMLVILATLVAGYFYLRAVWIAASALLAVEQSDHAFWTFVQVLFFPVGVWFLEPRLRNLLAAPLQRTASSS